MPFCPNCGKEVSESVTFCPDCGQRLKKGFTPKEKQKYIEKLKTSIEEEKPAKKTKMTKGKLAATIVAYIIGIAAFLIICLVPLKEVAYTVSEDEPYEDTETYYETEPYEVSELLQFRELDAFTTEAVKNVTGHAAVRGYDLPSGIVEYPDYALYVVMQNLDDCPGTFEVHYTVCTADKNAAERQRWLFQRTPEEYAELDREYDEGSIELYLKPGEVGVAICPPGGVFTAPDRVPFDHEHEIIPDTKTKTEYRQVGTRYKKLTLLDYWLHY